MKKSWMIFATCVLALSLTTGSAFAKSDNGKGNAHKEEASDITDSGAAVHTEIEAETDTDTDDTVTSATYGNKGHNGSKGLLHAINNVKDKPAGAILADILLTKYETKLTAEMKAELESIKEQDIALSKVAEILDENGSVTDAVYVQKDAIRANVKNLDSYKKLGRMYKKLGKKGMNLYVNGEEPTFATAPFIRDGSTLVPFRAIAEALKAEVSWNQEEHAVTVTRDGITIVLYINSMTALVNGEEVTLDAPAAIVDGSTVIPVRFISEALQTTVKWDQETQSVIIYEE